MVESAFLQKGVVIAHFHDLSVLHDKNEVGISNGGKAVSHDEGGLALHQLFKGIADLQLGTGIDVGGRFVQNQHGRHTQHDACDAK